MERPSHAELRVDGTRLWDTLMAMAEIGATPAGGNNRQALTEADRAGRDLFRRWCEEAGLTVEIDAMGNLFARRAGGKPGAAPIVAGSHLDTQPTGGRFDGVYGVLAALEVLRTLNDAGVTTHAPFEAVVWTNEEGVRFAPAMLGSGVWAGVFSLDYAYAQSDADGITLGDALRKIGYCGTHPVRPRPLAAAFEAHIEQGPILEDAGNTIGVVTGVQGMRWYDVTYSGFPCHAGPTPMAMRRDPMRAVAALTSALYEMIDAQQPEGRLTFGELSLEPGSRNTVAAVARLSIDLRHPDQGTLDALHAEVVGLAERAAREHRVEVSVDEVWHSPAVTFETSCVEAVRSAAARLDYSHQDIVSGAGHDAVYVSRVAPTGMIFVPCAGGLSHNEAESADPADLEAGANVLLHAMLAIDAECKEDP